MSSTERTALRAAPTDYEATINDIADQGIAAIRFGGARVKEATSDIGETVREALQSVRDTLADAAIDSIKTRPYTTLAIAGLVGFAYGAFRRR